MESVYQECLGIEFKHVGIPFIAQPELSLKYCGQPLVQKYRPDFVCFQKIIVEINAISAIADEHRAQVINYSNASGLQLGILVNFGQHPKLHYKRLALSKPKSKLHSRHSRATSLAS